MASRKPWTGSGSTGVAAVTVDVRSPGTTRVMAGGVAIQNLDLVNPVTVSFDNGTSFNVTIKAGQGFSTGPCVLDNFRIHGAGLVVAYQWVAVDKEEG